MEFAAGSRGVFVAMFEKEKDSLSPWTTEQIAGLYAPSRSGVSLLQNHYSLFQQIWMDQWSIDIEQY